MRTAPSPPSFASLLGLTREGAGPNPAHGGRAARAVPQTTHCGRFVSESGRSPSSKDVPRGAHDVLDSQTPTFG